MLPEVENIDQLTGKQCRELLYLSSKRVFKNILIKKKNNEEINFFFFLVSAKTNCAGIYLSSSTKEYNGGTAKKVILK